MINILIIGASGCIGGEVARHLSQNEEVNKIVCVSRNIEPNSDLPKIIYARADITDQDSLISVMILHEITHVLHTAAMRTSACEEAPKLAADINITGTGNVYEASIKAETVKRVVFISTAAVYDQVSIQDDNIDEESSTKGYATYVATKLAGEDLARAYCRESDLQIVCIRPQILFGPSRGSEGSTAGVTNAVKALTKNQPYQIPFSGQYTFHFTEDIGPLFAACLLQPAKDKFSVFNLPGNSISIEKIIQTLNELHPNNLLSFQQKQYPFAKSLNYQKFVAAYGDVHLTPFSEALQMTLKAFQKNH